MALIVTTKDKLENLLTKNKITLKNLWGLEQDMSNLLDCQSTICYQNCEDIQLKIDSKINRLVFNKCKNIVVELSGVISGIEVNKSFGITINVKRNLPINSLIIEKSKHISLSLSKKHHNQTYYQVSNSHAIIVKNHKERALYLTP